MKGLFDGIGVKQYCILYQHLVNKSHDSKSGLIDVAEIIKHLENGTANEGGSKFNESDIVILDFENPYTWALVNGEGYVHTDSNGNKIGFNEIKQTLIDTITTLKAKYPTKKWGYWGFPHLPEWLCTIDKIVNPNCQTPTRIDQATPEQVDAIKNHLYANFKEVIDVSDVFGVDMYQRDVRDGDRYGNDNIDAAKSRINAELCKMLDPTNEKLKIGWISNMYFKELVIQQDTLSGFELIPFNDLYSETIKPWIDDGMDGLFVWTAMNYRFNQITSPLSSDSSQSSQQLAIRKSFNENYLAGSGGTPDDDIYWTNENIKPIIKNVFTNQIYLFCKNILDTMNKENTVSMEQAQKLFKDKFRVSFGFDGEETVDSNKPGEFRRAVGWGGEESTFTWKRFITLEDNYNPSQGELNPWSLKKWYQWGARKFHFHNPFGKVARGKSQSLVYEVDQFLNAKNGLVIGGEVQNTKMPWLVNDFVPVIKALTTGQQGSLDQATWDSWTVGKDAWFNPLEPIDLIVYIGSLADPHVSDLAYGAYIDRWEEHFKRSPSGALARLKNSVAPLIDANCRIGFDAVCVAAGPIPGKNVPLERQCLELQKGWWSFWKWINNKIGKDRVYIESHPFKANGEPNPYLGWNVISDDDWSTSLCCPAEPYGPGGPHMTSEMGDVEFIRSIWQNSATRTPFISRFDESGLEIPERYYFLRNCEEAVEIKSEYNEFIEKRLYPQNCCNPGHNYYWSHLFANIIAFHMIEKQNTRGEINEENNITRSSLLIPNTLLQILPNSREGDKRVENQFGVLFDNSSKFIEYLANKISDKNRVVTSIYEI